MIQTGVSSNYTAYNNFSPSFINTPQIFVTGNTGVTGSVAYAPIIQISSNTKFQVDPAWGVPQKPVSYNWLAIGI